MSHSKSFVSDFFALSLPRFSIVLGKVTILILIALYLLYLGISTAYVKLFERAEKRVLFQKGVYQDVMQKKKLEEEEKELLFQLESLKSKLLQTSDRKKYLSFHECAQKNNIAFLSYDHQNRTKKSKSNAQIDTYKFRGKEKHIADFFLAIMKDQYPLFCVSIVSNREQDDLYVIQVGMKIYSRGAK